NSRQRDEAASRAARGNDAMLFSRNQTAFSKGATEQQEAWILKYAVGRWLALHSCCGTWRAKCKRFEKMADDDYSDRKDAADSRFTDARESIFKRQNHTLGLSGGFSDFEYAQARDDIFGTRPWLAATPQGPANIKLADKITKSAQRKMNDSNIEPVLLDALKQAADLGTAFVALRWLKDIETSESLEHVAALKSTGEPILNAAGDFITSIEDVPPETDPADLIWQERLIENAIEVQNNVEASLIDFNNIAFEYTADELLLKKTDVYHRFKMGVHDMVAAYDLSPEQRDQLITLCNSEGNETARGHRDETDSRMNNPLPGDTEANPEVWMVEGFIRCNPTGKRTVRLHVVFSPSLNALFRCDYLANITPEGILPIFPVRCFKVPNRITGKGYYERCEDSQHAIDSQYNVITLRNRTAGEVIKGVHLSALSNPSLAERDDSGNLVLSADKVHELGEDKTMTDLFSFAVIPDTNNRSDQLMQQASQMAQQRFGITSASQGEMKGLPESNTATGVRQIMSRGAVLIKWPITQMIKDVTPIVGLAVWFHFSNHDNDESFVWGEGKDAEHVELKSADVKGLKMKVTLTLTQGQNQEKLQNAQVAIGIVTGYASLPEAEKAAPRRVFVQALSSLGFDDADQLIRQSAADPAGIMALLPPDMQPLFQTFLQQQGMLPQDPNAAPAPGGEQAPQTASALPTDPAALPSPAPVAPVTAAATV
ncbi:MAG: hypothetical protein WCO57_04620, partial [Verrucomicrobiota bacterium]